jgi:NAD(P)H-hydrate repair Nnr-like enzyme with NAD(P)H-hydrate dehydratase domain
VGAGAPSGGRSSRGRPLRLHRAAEGRRRDVASAGHGLLVVDVRVPALATAGTGDVLTGVIAAFLAKGVEPSLAAAAAAVAHGRAAARADRGAGLVASDVVEALPGALAT